jgi:hypothetical protein
MDVAVLDKDFAALEIYPWKSKKLAQKSGRPLQRQNTPVLPR